MPDKKTYSTVLNIDINPNTSLFEKFKKNTDKWISAFNLEDTVKQQLIEATSQTWKWEQEFQKLLDLRDKLKEILKDTSLSEEARTKTTEKLVEANKELVELLEKQRKSGTLSEKDVLEKEHDVGVIGDKEYREKRLALNQKESDDDSFLGTFKDFIKGDKGSFGKSLKSAAISTFGPNGSLADTIVGGFKDIISSIASFVADMIKEAFERMEDMASFNLGLTNKYNESALSYFENWGLTGADAYAMQEALKSVGMDDVEDLFMAQSYGMNEVLEEFKTQFEYFKNEYENTDEEMLLTYQQFQKDWNDFKNHFQQEIITFFSNNKDLLTDVLNTLIDILPSLLDLTKGILEAIKFLLPHSVGETTKQASDIYESYEAVSNNSQIVDSHDITNYTFNGMTQSQMNEIKSSINKGNVEYYNSKAMR